MSKKRRVVITGMGALCGLGHNLPEIWGNIIDGKSGITFIEELDRANNIPIKVAGEVKNFKLSEDLISEKEARRFDQFIHFALHSTKEAIGDAHWEDNLGGYKAERVGTILGVGMGGFPMIESTHNIFLEKGARRVTPFFIPGIIPNMTTGLISIKFGTKGANYSIASACASAGHAITNAYNEIILNNADAMITGGAESVLCALPTSGFLSMKALSKENENPQKASSPFNLNRSGFVMGEGAGILIIEELESAKARGATIYAEIVGNGASSDAYHITAPHAEGEGAIRCMKQALANSNISSLDQIGYINAHGTATPLGDIAETFAIKALFGDHAYNLKISSTKSMIGHLLGAAGGIETIFTAKALHTGILPPTINLDTPDPQCDLDYIPNHCEKIQVEYAINNSFGFGGTNSSIILKRY